MKRLLLVEDEKLIRQGIKAIAMRAPIEIEEIIECKNGEEAYEVIKNTPIDVMITDIRMPKMDGITLVKKIQDLPNRPMTVVVSGYDDFSYAVELIRCGAKEYILKPVDREEITKILVKLDQEVDKLRKQSDNQKDITMQQLKYLLLNDEIQDEEIANIERNFSHLFVKDSYLVICVPNLATLRQLDENQDNENAYQLPNKTILLENINGNDIIITSREKSQELLDQYLKDTYAGVSLVHTGMKELRQAAWEALQAREYAYLFEKPYIDFTKECISVKPLPYIEQVDQYVQLIGTAKVNTVIEFLNALMKQSRTGEVSPEEFTKLMEAFYVRIQDVYKNALKHPEEGVSYYAAPFRYKRISDYIAQLSQYILRINSIIMDEHEDSQNKYKIQEAMKFIEENYDKDLNMAVVSNHISMNYSLFSYVFKQYAGMNFVNYLREIRIRQSKKLLAQTDYKISEISQMVGYENEKHYMKTFKNLCGVSPTEYRKNTRINQ